MANFLTDIVKGIANRVNQNIVRPVVGLGDAVVTGQFGKKKVNTQNITEQLKQGKITLEEARKQVRAAHGVDKAQSFLNRTKDIDTSDPARSGMKAAATTAEIGSFFLPGGTLARATGTGVLSGAGQAVGGAREGESLLDKAVEGTISGATGGALGYGAGKLISGGISKFGRKIRPGIKNSIIEDSAESVAKAKRISDFVKDLKGNKRIDKLFNAESERSVLRKELGKITSKLDITGDELGYKFIDMLDNPQLRDSKATQNILDIISENTDITGKANMSKIGEIVRNLSNNLPNKADSPFASLNRQAANAFIKAERDLTKGNTRIADIYRRLSGLNEAIPELQHTVKKGNPIGAGGAFVQGLSANIQNLLDPAREYVGKGLEKLDITKLASKDPELARQAVRYLTSQYGARSLTSGVVSADDAIPGESMSSEEPTTQSTLPQADEGMVQSFGQPRQITFQEFTGGLAGQLQPQQPSYMQDPFGTKLQLLALATQYPSQSSLIGGIIDALDVEVKRQDDIQKSDIGGLALSTDAEKKVAGAYTGLGLIDTLTNELDVSQLSESALPGRISGTLRKLGASTGIKEDPRLNAFIKTLDTVRTPLARALGEVGNLAEQEQVRSGAALPKPTDSIEEAREKIRQLKNIFQTVINEQISYAQLAGSGDLESLKQPLSLSDY